MTGKTLAICDWNHRSN